jgi:hypothetical protein
MTTRWIRAVRLAALALLLPLAGCFTMGTWANPPKIAPARLTGATIDAQGALAVGVEWSDGREIVYRQWAIYRGPEEGGGMGLVMAKALDRSEMPRFDHAPSSNGVRIEVASWHPVEIGGSGPLTIVVDPGSGSSLEIVDQDGKKRGFVEFSARGGIDWLDHGTWFRVVFTPVAVALDVVTLPIQAILLLFAAPRC